MTDIINGNIYYIANKGYGLAVEKVRVLEPLQVDGYFGVKSFDTHGSFEAHKSRLFEAEDEARSVVDAEVNKIKNKYRKQITDTQSLLQFMLDNSVSHCEE